jgi:hypothetical protein
MSDNEKVIEKINGDDIVDVNKIMEERCGNKNFYSESVGIECENKKQSFWSNLNKSWQKRNFRNPIRDRFKTLAGIKKSETVAALTLPNDTIIKFKELPSCMDVVKYRLCGFKYETYE